MTDEELVKRLRKRREAEFVDGYERVEWEDEDALEAADRIEALREKLAKAVEALRVLIQHAHNCEKELTEELHHQDFCGESLPLTNARATLAEIEGEKG